MPKTITTVTLRFLVAYLIHAFCICSHAAKFVALGDLPGGPAQSFVTDISADGTVVIGHSAVDTYEVRPGDNRPVLEAFRWSMETGMQGLGTLPGLPTSVAEGVSSNGSVIVGIAEIVNSPSRRDFYTAFRWTEEEGMVALDPLDGPCSEFGGWADWEGVSVSDDGATVVGASYYTEIPFYGCLAQATRITQTESAVGLGVGDDFDPRLNESLTVAASADGRIIAGYSQQTGANLPNFAANGIAWLWDEATGELKDLGFNNIDKGQVRATDMTPDAQYVIGYGRTPTEPFVWHEETGSVPIELPSTPTGISDDGAVIVGGKWLWTAAGGPRLIAEVLSNEFGLTDELAGWRLGQVDGRTGVSVTAISGDARVLAGTGLHRRNVEAWAVFLERPIHWILGDADHDFDVDFQDFLNLSEHFGKPGDWEDGDFDLNGTVEFADFLALSQNFGTQPVARSVVPEPNAALLLVSGLAWILHRRRMRRCAS